MKATTSTTSLWVHGATGRMGRAVTEAAARTDGVRIAGVIELRPGADPATPGEGVAVARGAPDADPNAVVIDFSSAGAVGPLIEALQGTRLPVVCGTTGISSGERDLLYVYSKESPVFYANNMSYGICLLAKLLRDNRPLLGVFEDVEIVEFHHRHKRDCPSGTALTLAEAIDPSAIVAGEGGRPGEGSGKRIPIHSVRAGEIPGTHEIHLASGGEVVTLTHRALSRAVFAEGAIRAARFIVGKPAGLYGMNDLLEYMNA
jgi:4-hydroxy-tetrahydrodipicolinate reductase